VDDVLLDPGDVSHDLASRVHIEEFLQWGELLSKDLCSTIDQASRRAGAMMRRKEHPHTSVLENEIRSVGA